MTTLAFLGLGGGWQCLCHCFLLLNVVTSLALWVASDRYPAPFLGQASGRVPFLFKRNRGITSFSCQILVVSFS